MAKKTAKKQARSAKSGKDLKKTGRKAAPPPEVARPDEAEAPKKGDSGCIFCGKPMKDARTKKIHERSCQSKSKEPEKQEKGDVEAAILDMKDKFQDQVESMNSLIRDREEQHQRELEEVKTVLRMEIDRHRKELERISKVEKEIAAEKQPAPESVKEPDGADVEKTLDETRPEPAQARGTQPKAIDLVPLPVPHLPKKRAPLPEDEAIPEIDDERPPADEKPEIRGLDREMVEDIVRSIIGVSVPSAGSNIPDNVAEKLAHLSGRLDHLDQKLERSIADLQRCLERIGKETDLKRIERELEKMSDRVVDIMEDSGYGESLSVSKIPPTILEIVYQAIIDDVYVEIMKTKGPQDAERVAHSALEEVRLKTSGSELFKFDGRKIVTDSLAKSIEANLISARQIQTTYDVLLERLLETVPHHKAKNFKGMIKVKSQEFAVDRATRLTKEFARLEKVIESTSQMIAAMSSNFNSQNLDIHETLSDIREKEMMAKADRDDVDALRTKLEESDERCRRLADELALLRAESDMKAGISEASKEKSEDVLLTPGEEPFVPSPDIAQPGDVLPIPEQAPPQTADEIAMQNETILSAVGRGFDSKKALVEETGLDAELLMQRISELVERKKLIEKRSGKRVRYTTLELEMEKARTEEPAPEPTTTEEPPKKEKKARKAKAPEPEKTAEESMQPAEPEAAPGPEAPPTEPEAIAGEKEAEPEKTAEPKRKKLPAKKEPKKTKEKTKKVKEPKHAPEPEEMPAPKPKVSPEQVVPPEPEPAPAEPEEPTGTVANDLPTVKKTLDELSEDEQHVLEATTAEGMTVSGIQSKVGKHMKRFALLRALRMLIDSGHVGIITKGRLELYYRINVEKMDKMDDRKRKTEVK